MPSLIDQDYINSQVYTPEFENALKLDSKNITTLCNLSSLYFDKKDFDKAEKFWEKAVKIDPDCRLAQDYLKKL